MISHQKSQSIRQFCPRP